MSLKQIQIKVSKEFNALRQGCKFQKCIFPDKSKCSRKLIKAHSVQKSKILSLIAEKGMVISSDMIRTLVTNEFEKIGINSASTFYGFCGYHDSVLFSEIENKDYQATKEQNFLHAYRACAIEYVKKKVACCVYEKMITKHQDSPFLQLFKNQLHGFQLGAKDLNIVLNKFSNELVKPKNQREYNNLSTTITEISYSSLFAVNSCFVLEYDFNGRLINDLRDTSKVPAHVFFNIFPQNGKTFILFSCLTENLDIYKEIISKIKSFPRSRVEVFFSNMIISHSENFFICPSKYYQMSKKLRKLVINKYMETMVKIEPDNIKQGSINLFRTFKK